MNWSSWYGLRSYVRSSLWVIPVIAVVFEQVLLRLTLAIDQATGWSPPWSFTPEATMAALQTIISLMLSFIVFTFGSMLVAIQVASGQLTPRIIATTLLRDNVIRLTVGLFIVTLLLAFGALNRVGANPPRLTVWVATALSGLSLIAFLYLIDYAARMLRPVSVVRYVAEAGMKVIDAVYPRPLADGGGEKPASRVLSQPDRLCHKQGASEIVLAVNTARLLRLARQHDGVIEMTARVGDFVAAGQPLFRLHGGAARLSDAALHHAVAFGPERTLEQDATFAFRVIVDIGIKALSKAINDPTTAVLSIDQLQRLLTVVAGRDLHNDGIVDADGKLRLILPTPNWDDFVQLTFCEMRLYGAENFQIARRLKAMLHWLLATLPEKRHAALQREAELLSLMVGKVYILPEDAKTASLADSQGLGGTG